MGILYEKHYILFLPLTHQLSWMLIEVLSVNLALDNVVTLVSLQQYFLGDLKKIILEFLSNLHKMAKSKQLILEIRAQIEILFNEGNP